MKIQFESSLLIAMAPAVTTSLIDGIGQWSNSRNFKKEKALEAIRSFRQNVERSINNPSGNYYENLVNLSNLKLQRIVMFLNQWSVYLIDKITLKQIIKQALTYEIQTCLFTLKPVAKDLKMKRNIKGYLELEKQFLPN